MKINKKDVVAYITARKEAEIIYIHWYLIFSP
jgi:hypothetical protein